MDEKKEQFLKRLYDTFRVEAEEHIRAISDGLLELGKNPAADRSRELIETTFREAHSLKGAARSVDLREVESVCQRLESVLSALKRREILLSLPVLDLSHQAINIIAQLISSAQGERTASDRSTLRELMRQLDDISKTSAPAVEPGTKR